MKRKLKNNILFQPTKVKDYSKFFAALGKTMFHAYGGKDFDKVVLSFMDVGAAIGLEETDERLAWDLVNHSVIQAISDLVRSNRSSIRPSDEASFIQKIEELDYEKQITLDHEFFLRPKEYSFVKDIQEILHKWLLLAEVEKSKAKAIVSRFPGFFVYSLHNEWSKNSDRYKRLFEETPFTDLVAAEDDWDRYKAYLEKQTLESVFDDAFSLSQIFVPLCAYYEINEEKNRNHGLANDRHSTGKVAVDLETCIKEWMNVDDREDAIRIISGGPGSGKSSFAKMFAASISSTHNVLLVPLYQLDLRRDVKEVVGEFLVSNRFFNKNPIGETEQLLIIFDGLDEIMQQGKASLEAARDFVSQALQLLRDHNNNQLRIRVIITGRDLPVQTIESNFRKEKQILHVLAYYVQKNIRETYIDHGSILEEDRRELWFAPVSHVL